MTKLKNDKGITLVALGVYIASMLIVLAILAAITANFRDNVGKIDKETEKIAEFGKFNLYMLEEVKKVGNDIEESSTTRIVFTSGNKYEFVNSEIYLTNSDEEKIKIAEKIDGCTFVVTSENGKKIIKVTIKIGTELRTQEYILGQENGQINYEDENNYIAKKEEKMEEYVDESGQTAIIPEGFDVSDDPEEQSIDDGLIVKDKIGNEFVWVPVPDASKMYKIENDKKVARLYTFSATNPPVTASSSFTEPNILTQYDNTPANFRDNGVKKNGTDEYITSEAELKAQMEEEFDYMIRSVIKYGGFYVGKYETGYDESGKLVVQRNRQPVQNENWYTMYQYQKEVDVGGANVISCMIYGCAWDQMMMWMEDVDNTKTSPTKKYITDSTGMGHYGSGTVILTGSNENYQVNQIYDLAGNTREWTQEANKSGYRMLRGGYITNSGSSNPASNRSSNSPLYTSISTGGRVQLYIKLEEEI